MSQKWIGATGPQTLVLEGEIASRVPLNDRFSPAYTAAAVAHQVLTWPAPEEQVGRAVASVADGVVDRVSASATADEGKDRENQCVGRGANCRVLCPFGEVRPMNDVLAVGFNR